MKLMMSRPEDAEYPPRFNRMGSISFAPRHVLGKVGDVQLTFLSACLDG